MKSFLSILFFSCSFFSSAQSWNELNQKLIDFANAGQMDSALLYGKKQLLQAESEFGKKHNNYVKAINILALTHDLSNDFASAEPLYHDALSLQKELTGERHPDYIQALEQLAGVYTDHSNAIKVIAYLEQAKDLQEQVTGEYSSEYAKALENLAAAYDDHGEYEKAEPLFLRCMDIRKKIFGESHPAYASVINNIALLYAHTGRYREAVQFYNQSLEIKKKNGGETKADYAVTLNNLASLYCDMGEYEKAEPYFLQAQKIDEGIFGKNSQQYAGSLNNLGTYYYEIGENEKAVAIFMQALGINKNLFGEVHAEVGVVLHNLGQLHQRIGEFEKSETFYEEAIRVRNKTLGPDHPRYVASVLSLAGLYYSMGEYEEAEPLFKSALESLKVSVGESHPSYATGINNLALVYTETMRFKEAENLLLQALAISKKNGLENDPNLSNYQNNLAIVYQHTGNFEKVEQLFESSLQASLKNLQRNFSFLSEQEKEKFAANTLIVMNGYQSFYYEYARQKPAVGTHAYDIELAAKGMILNTGIEMRQAIQNSGDKSAMEIYNKWALLKSSLAREYALPVSDRNSNLAAIENQVQELEKQLTRLSAAFNNASAVGLVKWKMIRERLKENEVAIEFSSFKYRTKNGWTDSMMYTALVLRNNDLHPHMVYLCESKQLDSLLNNPNSTNQHFITALYRGLEGRSNQQAARNRQLYQLLWKPLDHLLKPGDIIYFAPSAILNQLAFAAIPWDSTTLLSDRYQLHQLSSTAVLLKPTESIELNTPILLFGGIQYSMTEQEMLAASRTVKKNLGTVSQVVSRSGDEGETWNYLPGTLSEIKAIATTAARQKVKYTIQEGKNGTEEIFKQLSGASSPSIIHIATHGFFFPDPEKQKLRKGTSTEDVYRTASNPLQRSGLILAGANRAWKGESLPPGVEDGILTAYEAGNLYFGSTKLVVLSACETGLGDVKGSEGVFGLQRSFKMAGVDHLMMSLWKVPDAETAEFMEYFYNNLFGGRSVQESFALTQTLMKKKYPRDPYKWAAFILVR